MARLADIELVKGVVLEAGRKALTQFGNVAYEYKADHSLVTEVDRETERVIRDALKSAYPSFAFVGEESGWHGDPDQPVWACDPIDGTTNYVFGLPFWGVSVGLIHRGVPLLGVVHLPRMEELFWGVRGEGAFCNGAPLLATDRDAVHVEDTVCLTSNASKTLNSEAVTGRIRALGSIAAELLYTARGNLCATIGLHEGIVDITAAFCICFEAGCGIRYLDGAPMDLEALLRAGRTTKHFAVAPPNLLNHFCSTLHPR